MLVTVAKLSLNEEIEIVAGECLNRMILNLPPITLVEPIAVLCSNKHDNDELRNIGLTQALKLPKRFKDELQMVSKRFKGGTGWFKKSWPYDVHFTSTQKEFFLTVFLETK